MSNEKNIVVPDYIKEDLDKNNKTYGSSVFNYIPKKDEVTEQSDFFSDSEINASETEKIRDELKSGYNGEKIEEKISVDALSGIKSSIPINNTINVEGSKEDFETLDATLEASDIKGKRITKYGRQLVSSLIGEEPNEDEVSLISSKFEELRSEIEEKGFFNMDDSKLSSFLSERINNQLKSICNGEGLYNQYHDITARFLQQIYTAYNNTIEYRDDIAKLNELAKEIDDSKLLVDEENKNNNDYTSLPDFQKKIETFMETMKNLDSRNAKLKQNYTIDDIDIRLVEDIKECLDISLNFTKVIEKTQLTEGKFRNDLKRRQDTDKSIENWIHSIKHDPKTLFTFPCNDFLTDSECREELVKFFYNAYLAYFCDNYNLTNIPEDLELDEYLLKSDYVDKEYLNLIKDKSYVILYVLSRTFKYNKVEGNDKNIRILSYTLDIISKLGIKVHRDNFISAMDNVYCIIYKK